MRLSNCWLLKTVDFKFDKHDCSLFLEHVDIIFYLII